MSRRFLAVLIIGALCLAACNDDAPQERTARPLVTAGPDTASLFVHGVVTRGKDPVAGASVVYTLLPEDDDTKPGGIVDTVESKPVKTDADGHYALTIDPDRLTSRYFSGNYLNFDFAVYEGGTSASWGSTVWLVDDRVWRSDEQALVGDPVLTMSLDLTKRKITTFNSLGERESHDLPVFDEEPATSDD